MLCCVLIFQKVIEAEISWSDPGWGWKQSLFWNEQKRIPESIVWQEIFITRSAVSFSSVSWGDVLPKSYSLALLHIGVELPESCREALSS